MFSFKKKSGGERLSALVPGAEGTATATIRRSRQHKPILENCGFYPLAPGQELVANVQSVVRDQGLGKTDCTTVLDMGDYQLLLVEAPEVPPSELRAAIRWRIRDLIDFHIDDAILDVFDAPASGAGGLQGHLYVVVSRSSVVKEHVELLQQAGAALQVIDIPELALRNIAAQLDQDMAGQALLYFQAERGLITLTREATLYLARNMDIGYRQLQETPALVDRLALELQRSMDYYDRHFQQASIASIALCPIPGSAANLIEQLEQQLGIPVHAVDLEEIVEIEDSIEKDQLAACLLAIGAALRTEPAEL